MEIKEDKYRDVGWKQFFEVFDMVGFILIIFVMGIFGFLYVIIVGGNFQDCRCRIILNYFMIFLFVVCLR